MDDGVARRRRAGARHLDVHGRGRAVGRRDTGREPDTGFERDRSRRRPPRRRTAVAPSTAPTPQPSAADDTTGSGNDVVVPIIVALIVLGAGAAYLLSRRNRPTTPPPPTTSRPTPRRLRRDPAARGAPGERPRGGDRPCPGPARDGRGPRPEPDLHEPAAARGLPRRRGDGGRPVVRVRHRPRRPGGAAGPHLAGDAAAGLAALSGCASSG